MVLVLVRARPTALSWMPSADISARRSWPALQRRVGRDLDELGERVQARCARIGAALSTWAVRVPEPSVIRARRDPRGARAAAGVRARPGGGRGPTGAVHGGGCRGGRLTRRSTRRPRPARLRLPRRWRLPARTRGIQRGEIPALDFPQRRVRNHDASPLPLSVQGSPSGFPVLRPCLRNSWIHMPGNLTIIL